MVRRGTIAVADSAFPHAVRRGDDAGVSDHGDVQALGTFTGQGGDVSLAVVKAGRLYHRCHSYAKTLQTEYPLLFHHCQLGACNLFSVVPIMRHE